MPAIEIVVADLSRPEHARDVLLLIDAYSHDEQGQGAPLADDVRERLVAALSSHPTTQILLAYADGEPVGIATCFLGFSTFAARQLLNVHDLAVRQEWRSTGVGRQLLAAVEQHAHELGCCKVTMEVHLDNPRAKSLYEHLGYRTQHEAGTLYFTKAV